MNESDNAQEKTTAKSKKGKKKNKSKKINLTIAPANWTRMKRHIQSYNESGNRTGPKLKYTDVINEAINRYIVKNSGN